MGSIRLNQVLRLFLVFTLFLSLTASAQAIDWTAQTVLFYDGNVTANLFLDRAQFANASLTNVVNRTDPVTEMGRFDGVNSFGSRPPISTSGIGTGDFTLLTWIRLQQFGRYHGLLGSNAGGQFNFHISNITHPELTIGGTTVTTPFGLTGAWHLTGVMRQNNRLFMIIDDLFIDTGVNDFTDFATLTDTLGVGSTYQTGSYVQRLDGDIAKMFLLRTSLEQINLTLIKDAGRGFVPNFPPGPPPPPPPPPPAINVTYGSIITSSTTLAGQVLNSSNGTVAQGPGLIIGGPGITLDCAGFPLIGSGVNIGVDINGHDNVIIRNCNITNFATGINTVNAQSNSFTSNTLANTVDIASTSGTSHSILGNGNFDVSLTNSNGIVLDGTVGAYTVTNTPFTFQNAFGNVAYTAPVTQSAASLASDITITQNSVTIDGAARPGLNQPATVTLSNTNVVSPVLYRDGVECTAQCSNLNFAPPSFTFDVTGFSTYSLGENSTLVISDQGDLGRDTNTTMPISFFANYANATGVITGAACSIDVNGTSSAMAFNSSSNLYEYSQTFFEPGLQPYNATCTHASFPTRFANDSVVVNGQPLAGSTIFANVTLDRNLLNSTGGNDSPSFGLTIGAHGITLDCAGFEIRGSNLNSGIVLNGFENITIQNCNITNFAEGITATSTQGSLFQNNQLSANTLGVNLNLGTRNTLDNNSDTSVTLTNAAAALLNQNISTFTFTSSIPTFSSLYGLLEYNAPVTESGNLANAIQWSPLFLNVDSTLEPGLNQPANITFFNVGLSQPHPARDGAFCAEPTCANTAFSANTFKFTTLGFSNFSLVENSTLTVYDQGDALGGSLPTNSTLPVKYFADFRNVSSNLPIENGVCDININGTVSTMDFNASGSLLYNHTQTIFAPGLYSWNVSCSSPDFVPNFVSDDVLITGPPISGTIIYNNTVLPNNLLNSTGGNVSSGNGLVIGAHGITLDCAGYQILGSGANDGININGFENVTIKNCNVSNFNIGIRGITTTNLLLDNNTLESNTVDVDINGGARNKILGTQRFNLSGNAADFTIANTDISLANQTIEGFTFTNDALTLENEFVKVAFNQPVTESGPAMNDSVQLLHNFLDIDTTTEPGFNQPANVTFFQVNLGQPILFRNGVPCTDAFCNNTNFAANTFTFNVTGFSNLTLLENTTLSIFDPADPLGGNLDVNISTPIRFVADYRNFSSNAAVPNSTCNININSTSSPMTYNDTTGVHNFTTSFALKGFREWNVSCSAPGVAPQLVLNESITITGPSLAGETIYNDTTLGSFLMNITGGNVTPGFGLRFGAHGITLDCNGFEIRGSGNNAGIIVQGFENATIRNCAIRDYTQGIMLENASGATVTDSNILTTQTAIDSSNSTRHTLTNNVYREASSFAVHMRNTTDASVTGSSFLNNTGQGVFMEDGLRNTISSNNFLNTTVAVNLLNSSFNTISNNVVNDSLGASAGIAAQINSMNNTFDGNTITGTLWGFSINTRSDFNTLTNNKIRDVTFGFNIGDANRTKILNNQVNVSQSAVSSTANFELEIKNNVFQNTSAAGIALSGTTQATVSDNTMIFTFGDTFSLLGAQNTVLDNNNIIRSEADDLNFGIGTSIVNVSNHPPLEINFDNAQGIHFFSQNVTEYTLVNAEFCVHNVNGEVCFIAPVTDVGGNLSQDITLTKNKVEVNISAQPGLNVAANVSLLNVGTFYDPVVYRNDTDKCPTNICTFIDSTLFTANDYQFNVTGWSSYSIGENGDPYENDDEFINATFLLPNGNATRHNFLPQGDVDYLSWNATGGLPYRVETFGLVPALTDTLLTIYNSTYAQVGSPDDNSGNGTFDSRIIFTAPESGTFFARISEVNNGVNSSYSVAITELPDLYESNDVFENATVFPGGNIRASLPVGDVDIFSFPVTTDFAYELNAHDISLGTNVTLTVHNASNISIIAATGTPNGTRLIFQPTENGTYFVNVTPTVLGSNGSYLLNLTQLPFDLNEEDDNPGNATLMPIDGTQVRNNFLPPGDQDWFQFNVTAGLEYVLESGDTNNLTTTNLSVFDPTLTLVGQTNASGIDGGSRLTLTPAVDGVHFAVVQELTGGTGNYNFSILSLPDQYENNSNIGNASPIGFGPVQTHNFRVTNLTTVNGVGGNDVDVLSFAAGTGADYLINTTNLRLGADTLIEVLDAGNNVLAQNDNETPNDLSSYINFTAPAPGTYYIRVTQKDVTQFGSSYSIQVLQTGCVNPVAGIITADTTFCPTPTPVTITSAITITQPNVTLSCNNVTLIGDQNSPGIVINASDVTVQGCNLFNTSIAFIIQEVNADVIDSTVNQSNMTLLLQGIASADVLNLMSHATLDPAFGNVDVSLGAATWLNMTNGIFRGSIRPAYTPTIGSMFGVAQTVVVQTFNETTTTPVPLASAVFQDVNNIPRANGTTNAVGISNVITIPIFSHVGIGEFNFTPYRVNVTAAGWNQGFAAYIGNENVLRFNLTQTRDPQIFNPFPAPGTFVVPVSQQVQDFNFTLVNPDNQPVTVVWSVNGTVIPTVNPEKMAFQFNQPDDHKIDLVVSTSTFQTSASWILKVRSSPTSNIFQSNMLGATPAALQNINDLYILRPGVGMINYTPLVMDVSGVFDLDNNIIIEPGRITVDIGTYSQLNRPATLTMYNLPHNSTPQVFLDTVFNGTTNNSCGILCSNIVYDNVTGTLTFDVSQLSTYFVQSPIVPPTPNQAPVLGTVGNLVVQANESVQFLVNGTDPDGDTFTFSDNTALFNIDSATGLVNFTNDGTNPRNESVTITLTDGSLQDQVTFNTELLGDNNVPPPVPNNDPVLGNVPNQAVQINTTYAVTVNGTDPDGDIFTFSDNTNLFDIDPATGAISFFHNGSTLGNQTITITLTDNNSNTDIEQFILELLSDNSTGSITNPPTTTGMAISDFDLGSSSTKRLSNVTATFAITNNEASAVSNLAFTSSLPPEYKVIVQLPATIASGASASANLSITVPVSHDAVDSSCKPSAIDVGSLQITSGSIVSNSARIEIQAENMLEVKDAEVTGLDGDGTETAESGDTVDVERNDDLTLEVEVENNFDDDDDDGSKTSDVEFDEVTLELRAKDGDIDTDSDDEISGLDANDEETLEVDFEVDDDADDGKHGLEVRICGEDENGAKHGENYDFDVEVDIPNNQIDINAATLASSLLSCDQPKTQVDVSIENTGKRDNSDSFIRVKSDDLGFNELASGIDLDEEDRTNRNIEISIPEDTKPGRYTVRVEAGYDGKVTDTDTLDLRVEECRDTESTTQNAEQTTQSQLDALDLLNAEFEAQQASSRAEHVAKSSKRASDDTDMVLIALGAFLIFLLICTIIALLLMMMRK